jgi:hypothetical protein
LKNQMGGLVKMLRLMLLVLYLNLLGKIHFSLKKNRGGANIIFTKHNPKPRAGPGPDRRQNQELARDRTGESRRMATLPAAPALARWRRGGRRSE